MANQSFKRNRSKVKLNYNLPVLVVSRSNQNIAVQLLEPVTKRTLFTLNSYKIQKGSRTEKSLEIGKQAAQKLKDLKFDKVVFDRNGFIYHGRVKAVADAIRENGIQI